MSYLCINETSENWVKISLNRPDKKNALNAELIQELTQAFQNIQKNSNTQGVLLTAQGSCFCAGADLSWMHAASSLELESLYRLFKTMDSYSSPLVALCFGSIFGGGIGLLSVCDFVYADPQTQFCFSELKLGLMPALIAPFILKNKPLLKKYLLSGKPFGVKEALNLQLIDDHGENSQKWFEDLALHLKSLNLQAFKETKVYLKELPEQKDPQKFSIETLIQRKQDPQTVKNLNLFLNRKK